MRVEREHFLRAALEIGQNGENDTLPYDIDAAFVRDKAEELSKICSNLFSIIDSGTISDAISLMSTFTINSERLLVPSGSHGFRITTKIHPFWNLYLNGLGLAIAEANEQNRSDRVHSYRLGGKSPEFFDGSRSWRAYKEATIKEKILENDGCVVIQTDIASFYEHIYHHPLQNIIKDMSGASSTVAVQIDRILGKLAAGRSFGLLVGGQCARVLAEVMMAPIDRNLSEKGIIWHRYVDDFTLICDSQQSAYRALSELSNALADYGLTLNRSKTTFLSAKHYAEYISAQLGIGEDASVALRELDLHFDPYSDTARVEYEQLKQSFERIDIQFLLDLEKEKSQPDNFVLAQIGRALKFQEPHIAAQLCATLLDPKNLDTFRASWSKIMRGVYSVRSNDEFKSIFDHVDDLLDRVPSLASHLLVSEANILHFLRAIRFKRTAVRSVFVRRAYEHDFSSSQSVKRACIDCWRHWADRDSFVRLRNKWQNLGHDEQRMYWLAAKGFGDEGKAVRKQLSGGLTQAWRLGFEAEEDPTFASCYQDWVRNATC